MESLMALCLQKGLARLTTLALLLVSLLAFPCSCVSNDIGRYQMTTTGQDGVVLKIDTVTGQVFERSLLGGQHDWVELRGSKK